MKIGISKHFIETLLLVDGSTVPFDNSEWPIDPSTGEPYYKGECEYDTVTKEVTPK